MSPSKKKKKSRSRQAQKDCSRCSREDGEAFRCYDNTFKFDVTMARAMVADGRQPVELHPDDIEYSLNRCEINEAHIDHVDETIPGIVTHVYFPDKEEAEVVHHAHRLIDGHHRAARCLRLQKPFYVHVLSEAESIRILERGPEEARPSHLLESE